jgi:hypothetical protein
MAYQWLGLTVPGKDKKIHVNFSNVSSIEELDTGSRIWLLAEPQDGSIVVLETADRILRELLKGHNAYRS